MKNYLAIDIGAGSGRAILGSVEYNKVSLKEIHRFSNSPIKINGSEHWNIENLFNQIIESLKYCIHNLNIIPESIAIDTWGVDYGLLNKDGELLNPPFTYRDKRNNNSMDIFTQKLSKKEIYSYTGIQFLQFNTLFQLQSEITNNKDVFDNVADLLFIPDLLNYFLTGIKKTEFTFATTSQLFNPQKMEWESKLFDAHSVSLNIMQDIVKPGTKLGLIKNEIAELIGAKSIPVVSVASHDTGSAIAAIPAKGKKWAYLSSGTWSLMGIETDKPIINEKSYEYNFTNEGGVEDTFRFLKNMTGLWLLQRCKSVWDEEHEISYDELRIEAEKFGFTEIYIDPDDDMFLNPANMVEAIKEYCKKSGQNVPEATGEIVNIILQALALNNRYVIDQLEEILGDEIEDIYITGGGVQNKLLNQYIANATMKNVITTVPEGTATGNIMVQALADGEVKSLSEIRNVIGNSITMNKYKPENIEKWNSAYEVFKKVKR